MTTEPHRDWQRGLLSTCVLAALDEGAGHGYALAQRLQASGLGPVKGGALYPVLNRLEEEGAVSSTWREGEGGPGRKVFSLTDSGHARLDDLRASWPPFAGAVAELLGVTGRPAATASAVGHERQGER